MLRTSLALFALTLPLPAGTKTFQAFEGDGFDTWTTEGTAFGLAPSHGKTDGMEKAFTAYSNDALASSLHGGEAATGSLTSPEFTITEPYITFLIAGGNTAGKTAAQLIVDGKVVRESVGKRSLRLEAEVWSVADLKGKTARIRLLDDETGPWGFIALDHIIFTDYPNQKFPSTTREGKAFVDGLVATDVVPGVNIPEGSSMKIEATFKEHGLTSPTAITFDDQGRIYVAETHRFREGVEDNRDHLYWYLDDLASKKVEDRRALHEKWKDKKEASLDKLTRKSEVIRRLADTDGDGKIDEAKIFADGFNDVLDGTAAGIFYHEGSIYFACIPKIWTLRDTDNDGVADERKVVEEGFGVRISLSGHDLNGFTLGPDGRIYGTVGDRGLSLVTKAGVAYDYPNEGAAFRFEPDGTGFELFHTGLRNPKEIAFDSLGNAFSVDNNSDQGDAARVVYLVEGGDSGWQMEHQALHSFHRQIGLENHPDNRWMAEKMWELQNSSQPAYILPPSAHLTAGPSGLTYHPGAGFLESEAGRFLVCDYRGGAANSGIWSFEMKPKGAGMEMTDSRQFLWGVAATDVEYSWDGRVFVSDFITGWSSHQDGRLLSLDAGDKKMQAIEVAGAVRIMKQGFDHRSAAELANLLRHPDMRIRLRAQIALTRTPDALKHFSEAASSSIRSVRIHGIWGLGILARRGSVPKPASEFGDIPTVKNREEAEKKLIELLADKDPEIRAQAIKVLADSKNEKSVIPIAKLLADESPRVRFYAAMLVGKLNLIGSYGQICDLLEENDNRDVYLRHAGIYALQHLAENPMLLTGLATHHSPAVRLAAVVALRRKNDPGVANFVWDADPVVADEAIRAVCDKDMMEVRGNVADILDEISGREWTPFMLRRLVHNAFRAGGEVNAVRLLKVAADASLPEAVRMEAFRLLGTWTEPFPVDQFTGHWNPLEKRPLETIRPALISAIPAMLKADGFVLTGALQLVKRYQVDLPELDEAALRAMIGNENLPDEARSLALELLIPRKPADLQSFLSKLATDSSDHVALTALATIAKMSPESAVPALEAALDSSGPARAQKIWPILSGLPGESVDAIFMKRLTALQDSKGISPYALELVDAAKKRKDPAVKERLVAFEKSLAENSDPLAKFNVTLEGGDPKAGASLFASHPASECMRCHRAEDGHSAGGETAPNLAGIAKRHQDRRYFLESMVAPGAVIAPGFGTVLVDFKNGTSISGNVIAETPDHLDLDAEGKAVRILRSDVSGVTTPVSPMPSMEKLLKPGELRDIIAWLATLDKGGEDVKAPATPEPLDPATLVKKDSAEASSDIDPEVMKLGKQQFMVCGACHGQNGEGTAAGPPLAGSEWVLGPEENLIRIQLRGLTGPIKVKGVEYNMPGGMAPLAYQTDEQIAAVITFIRNSFGNKGTLVTPEAVTALRGEVGKPQVTVQDLLVPSNPDTATVEPEPGTESSVTSSKYDNLDRGSNVPKWLAGGALLLVIAFVAKTFLKK